jgi:limonene-1,2-epoxide hydrolase
MSNIDIIRKFYSLPRITSEDRRDLLSMFHEDVHYVGVGKESARGRDAIERLFRKYEASGRGITSLKFDIRHIAENGNAVLVDMVDTFVVDGKEFSGVWSVVFEIENGKIRFWQEHYDVAKFEQMYAKGIPVTESATESARAS